MQTLRAIFSGRRRNCFSSTRGALSQPMHEEEDVVDEDGDKGDGGGVDRRPDGEMLFLPYKSTGVAL